MNKQILLRILISFPIIGFFFWIVVPAIGRTLRMSKSSQNNYHDIDDMVKNKQGRLRAMYGGNATTSNSVNNGPRTIDLSSNITKQVTQHYSLSLTETKVQNFLHSAEKRKLSNFLSAKNQQSTTNQINFLFQALVLWILIEEITKKSFTMSQILSKKLSLNLFEFSMGIQIKLLLHMKPAMRTEEQVFSENYCLHTFSQENIVAAFDSIVSKEADLWAQSPSLLFEELSLYFHYASIVQPLPELKSKNDAKTAFIILGCLESDTLDLIKKKYKKMALLKHPDKIIAQKLPPRLEKKGIENFKKIQEAYEIISEVKK